MARVKRATAKHIDDCSAAVNAAIEQISTRFDGRALLAALLAQAARHGQALLAAGFDAQYVEGMFKAAIANAREPAKRPAILWIDPKTGDPVGQSGIGRQQ